jgi:hypothetical protein
LKDDSAHIFEKYGIEKNARSAGRLDLALRCWIRLLREIKAEAFSHLGIKWTQRLRALRMGFGSGNACLYEFGGARRSLYVPDFSYALHCYRMNGFLNPIVGNKLVLSHVLAANGIPHPPVLGTISRGRAFPIPEGTPSTPLAALCEWASGGTTTVLRPHWSGGGEGVFFLGRAGGSWLINGREAPESDVAQLAGGLDRYIATAFVEQGEYSRAIQPATTNTLRVLALSDESGPFVSSVVHRFGTARSFPIDNFHQGVGGICAAVDAVSGQLGQAVSLDENLKRATHTHHPETGARIEGVSIPGLAQALVGVLAAMRCFPEAVCIGWDLVMTGSGFSILEANSPPGLAVFQAHAPLLADARTARVFASHGITVRPAPRNL